MIGFFGEESYESPVEKATPLRVNVWGSLEGRAVRVGRLSGPGRAYVTVTSIGSMTFKCLPGQGLPTKSMRRVRALGAPVRGEATD